MLLIIFHLGISKEYVTKKLLNSTVLVADLHYKDEMPALWQQSNMENFMPKPDILTPILLSPEVQTWTHNLLKEHLIYSQICHKDIPKQDRIQL